MSLPEYLPTIIQVRKLKMIFLITKTQKQASKIRRWYYIFRGSAAHNLELNDC
jgi:hypothetical protein